MKIAGLVILVLIVGILLTLLALAWNALGTTPTATDRQKFAQSPQWKSDRQVFDNRIPNLRDRIRERLDWKFMFRFFTEADNGTTPAKALPESQVALDEFLKPSDSLKVIWLGHSSLLLNINSKIILVDPVLSGYASPLSFAVKRFQKTSLSIENLPAIDYVVISHDHYDHLDMPTMKAFVGKTTKFLVPLGVGSHLRGWGITPENITELDWWESRTFDKIDFVATPAQHFSGRSGLNDQSTLWASWVIKTEKYRVYFSGDSGYDTHFKDIGAKYGPFDIAFLENGQYNVLWPEVHLLPEDVLKAYDDLNAKRVFPIHWGAFKLSTHPWQEPIALLAKAAEQKNMKLISPMIGQQVIVNDDYVNKNWWDPAAPLR